MGATNKSVEAVACTTSIFFDDLLNGNITADGEHFYMGSTNIYQRLSNIDANVTALANDLTTNAKSDLQSLQTKATAAMGQIEVFPNTTANASFVLVYNDPTTRSSSGTKVTSLLGGMLGNAADYTSLCGVLYNGINGLKSLLTSAINGLNGFNSSDFTRFLSAVTKSVGSMTDSMTAIDNTVPSNMNTLQNYVVALEAILIIFHIQVVLSVVLIIVYVFMTKRYRGLLPCLFKK